MADTVLRGRLLSFHAEPSGPGDQTSYTYVEDGVIRVEAGRIAAIGPAASLLPTLPPDTPVEHYPDQLILPGFIDLHIHLPQTQVIASYGAQLMEWLEKYTFVEEQKYADPAHAEAGARFFLDELLRNGTTTAVVYGSVHVGSIEAFFAESQLRGTGMIAGKTMMDRNAPPKLRDTAQSSYDDSKALITRWHKHGRQRYAVTPRFVVTSTPAQLDAAGALLREHPDVYMQTHLAENRAEIAAAQALYPEAVSYTDIYRRHDLLGPRSLFGHCIHLDESELDLLAASRSVAVFCPTSNLFLGSGLFNRARLAGHSPPVRIGLATDLGGGTSYSMLATAAEAYKVLQLQGQTLCALSAFHQMTRGNAMALGLDGEIGSLEIGTYADLVVLDAKATPAMAHRMAAAQGKLEDELFVLMTLGDDRAVQATYVQGRRAVQ